MSNDSKAGGILQRVDQVLLTKGHLVVLLLITITYCIVFRDYILFRKSFVFDGFAIDTISQFFPQEYFRLQKILSGSFPFWSFQFDLGVNVYSLMVNINPFDLVFFLFGPDAFIDAMPVVLLLKFIAAGLFFHAFLRRLQVEPVAALIGSLLFTFSGYMMINCHWYHYTNYAVFVALFLYLFEIWLQDGRWLPMVFVLGLISLKGELQLFQLAFFGAVYVLFRGVNLFGWSVRLLRLYFFLACFFSLGLLIGAYIYLPGVINILSSSRGGAAVTDASTLDTLLGIIRLTDAENLRVLLSRFIATDLLGSYGNYQGRFNYFEDSAAYAGLLAVLLFPFALVAGKGKPKLLWLFPVTVVLVLCFPFLQLALNGFASGTMKYLTLYLVVFVTLPATVVLSRLFVGQSCRFFPLVPSSGALFLGLAVVFAAHELAWSHPLLSFISVPDNSTLRQAVIFSFFYLLLFVLLGRGLKPSAFKYLVLVVVVLEVTLLARVTASRSSGALQPLFVERGENYFNRSTLAAIRLIEEQDRGFYRVEKGYDDGHLNDSMVQGYRGTKAYFGFVPGGVVDFYRNLELSVNSPRLASYRYGLEKRAPLQSLLGVKYFLCRSDEECDGLHGFSLLDTVEGVRVYRNDQVMPFGMLFSNQIVRQDVDRLTVNQKEQLLMHAVVTEEPLNGLRQLPVHQVKRAGIAGWPPSFTGWPALELSDWGDEYFIGTLNTGHAGLLFFPVPYDPGWQLAVNGQRTPLNKVDFGFLGALVPEAGIYEIELRYRPPYFFTALSLSVAGILISLLVWLRYPRIRLSRQVSD